MRHQPAIASISHILDSDMVKDMQKRFLARDGERIVERIQHLYMRVAVSIHMDDINSVLATYELLSSRTILHDRFMGLYAGTHDQVLASTSATSVTNADVQSLYNSISKCVFAARAGACVSIAAQTVPCSGRCVNSSFRISVDHNAVLQERYLRSQRC